MTDAEDQVRRYAAAVTRAQRPVELGELTTRSRHHPARRPAAVAAVLVVVVAVVVAAVAVVGRDHGSQSRVEVAPTTSPSTAVAPATNCPAASLNITSTSGERLHPTWLPPGFVLTSGNESDLGAQGFLTYSTPGNGDHPRVELLRYRSNQSLSSLYSGTTQRTLTVHGDPGILSVGVPQATPISKAVLWRPAPDLALVVNGYKVSDADLIRVAEGVDYFIGRDPHVCDPPRSRSDARGRSRRSAARSRTRTRCSLRSASSTRSRTGAANHLPTLATGIAVTQPVWVVWTSGAGSESTPAAIVIASGGSPAVAATVNVKERALDSLTDRSAPMCAPPFGVLTCSEVAYLRPPLSGANTVSKFTTEGALTSTSALSGFFDCSLDACDSTVPVWVLIQTATSQLFANMESRPPGITPGDTKPGSFSITMVDARTGPQSSNVGSSSELGSGPAPAGVLSITDLAPG